MTEQKSCADIIKQNDYDRYITALFAPPEKRDDLYALYAFNYEIAKTRETVSDTTLGLIRLTWWREAIDEIYEGQKPRNHEVVLPLAEVIKKYNLPKNYFETLIYAREFDLEDVLPADLRGLKNYADYTTTPLLALSSIVIQNSADEDNLKHASQAIALTGLLRAAPYQLQQRHCIFPQDLLDEAGLDQYMLYDGKGHDSLKSVVCDIVWSAEDHLKKINYNSEIKPIMAQVTLAKQYLKSLKRCDYNVFDQRFHNAPPFSMLRLLTNVAVGRI